MPVKEVFPHFFNLVGSANRRLLAPVCTMSAEDDDDGVYGVTCSTFYDDLDTKHSKVETKTTKGGKTKVYTCKYCSKGVSTKARFAEHLANIGGNTKGCPKATKEVTKQAKDHFRALEDKKRAKQNEETGKAMARSDMERDSQRPKTNTMLAFFTKTKHSDADLAIAMIDSHDQ